MFYSITESQREKKRKKELNKNLLEQVEEISKLVEYSYQK